MNCKYSFVKVKVRGGDQETHPSTMDGSILNLTSRNQLKILISVLRVADGFLQPRVDKVLKDIKPDGSKMQLKIHPSMPISC